MDDGCFHKDEAVSTNPGALLFNCDRIICPICSKKADAGEALTLPNCQHSFCIRCFQQQISIHINKGKAHQIHCPMISITGCDEVIDPAMLEDVLDSQTYEELQQYCCQKQQSSLLVLSDPSKSPDCMSLPDDCTTSALGMLSLSSSPPTTTNNDDTVANNEDDSTNRRDEEQDLKQPQEQTDLQFALSDGMESASEQERCNFFFNPERRLEEIVIEEQIQILQMFESTSDDAPQTETAVVNEYEYWLSGVRRCGAHLKNAPYNIRNDKKIVTAAVRNWSDSLQYATPELQNEFKAEYHYWLSEVTRRGWNLKDAPKYLRSNKAIVMAAVQRNTDQTPQFAPSDCQNDQTNYSKADDQYKKDAAEALRYASPDLQNDKQVVLEAVRQSWWAFQFASPDLRDDKGFVLEIIKEDNACLLKFVSPKLQNDVDVVMAAVENSKPDENSALCEDCVFRYASPSVRANRKVIMAAIAKDGRALQYAAGCGSRIIVMEALQKNGRVSQRQFQQVRQLVKAAVRQNGEALLYAPPYLRGDKDFMFPILRDNNGMALQYVTTELQNDKSIVLAAIEQSQGNAKRYASLELQNDEDVIRGYWLSRIRMDPGCLKSAPKRFLTDKEFIVKAVQKNGLALEFASPELQADKEVVVVAVRQNKYEALQFASPELRYDKDFILQVVQLKGYALQYAPLELRNDKQVVMAAVQKHSVALCYASPELRCDINFILQVVQQRGTSLQYVPSDLQSNKEVVLASVRQNVTEVFELLPTDLKQDKDILLLYIKKYPDHIKHIDEDLKRDKDILIAAGMFEEYHEDAPSRLQRTDCKKITLSTRFSLTPMSNSEATNFTRLFKSSQYIQKEGNFTVYAPNAFDKKTCDPDWTNFSHPCRGTAGTCKYNNILTDKGHPTDDCCWRYSFRRQLQEAKDTGGFMLQLVEAEDGKVDNATLGKGQEIELDMAQTLGTKVFQVYCPQAKSGTYEHPFQGHHIDVVTAEISRWYGNQCRYMSVAVIRQSYA